MIFTDEFLESCAKTEGNIRYVQAGHTYTVDTFNDKESVAFYDNKMKKKFTFLFVIEKDVIKIHFGGGSFFSSSEKVRASQIGKIFFNEVEKYLLKHRKFRVKMAMKQLELVFPETMIHEMEKVKISPLKSIFQDVIMTRTFIFSFMIAFVFVFLSFLGVYAMIGETVHIVDIVGIVLVSIAQIFPLTIFYRIFKESKRIYKDHKKAKKLLKETAN